MNRIISTLILTILMANNSFSQEKMHSEREVKKGMIITGACLFGTPWLISVVVASQTGSSYLPIPIVGPFITNSNETPESSEGFIVAMGLSAAETTGIILVTLGIIGKKKNSKHAMIYPVIKRNKYGLRLKMDL